MRSAPSKPALSTHVPVLLPSAVLAGGWPNVLTPRLIGVAAAKSSGSALHNFSYTLVGDGWNGRTVVPQLVASNLNYVVSYSFGATAIEDPDFSSKTAQVESRTSPVINPADTTETTPRRRVPSESPTGRAAWGFRHGE